MSRRSRRKQFGDISCRMTHDVAEALRGVALGKMVVTLYWYGEIGYRIPGVDHSIVRHILRKKYVTIGACKAPLRLRYALHRGELTEYGTRMLALYEGRTL